MRLALPNASFIGFTGTPLFKHDELTRRIFGGYISRYDFKRSEEDQSTVKLVYENRGEKLGLARLDLNDRIAEAVEEADLDQNQEALLERLLGRDYEVITADDRLDKLAEDFVEHCSTRWQSGKSMFVCIDKITCGRMLQRIESRWSAKIAHLQGLIQAKAMALGTITDIDLHERLSTELETLRGQAQWMKSTIIEVIISEAQNEVRDFRKWNVDIIPHRMVMKNGFQTSDGKRVPVEDAFKDPKHPFRIAIVCAMWLTGFDVECLTTLYIDKPMKAHNLMQAIARANRVFPGKDCGVIVDYNGMLKGLRAALALYATPSGTTTSRPSTRSCRTSVIPLTSRNFSRNYTALLMRQSERRDKNAPETDGRPRHPTGGGGEARSDAGPQSTPNGLLQEISGDHRRLQSGKRPGNRGGDVCPARRVRRKPQP